MPTSSARCGRQDEGSARQLMLEGETMAKGERRRGQGKRERERATHVPFLEVGDRPLCRRPSRPRLLLGLAPLLLLRRLLPRLARLLLHLVLLPRRRLGLLLQLVLPALLLARALGLLLLGCALGRLVRLLVPLLLLEPSALDSVRLLALLSSGEGVESALRRRSRR